MKKYIFLLLIVFSSISFSNANSPSYGIPWPVDVMSETKPLMSGYGDKNNDWDEFHRGIDIENTAEEGNTDDVRSVEYGWIIYAVGGGPTGDDFDIIIAPTEGAEEGWMYGHVLDPQDYGYNPFDPEPILEGQVFTQMNPDFNGGNGPVHVHFSRENENHIGDGLVNPLDYLAPEPEGSDYWAFNPEDLTPAFKHMFLPEHYNSTGWEAIYPTGGEAWADKIPDNSLAGEVDFFFGVALQGGELTIPSDQSYTDCAPERVYWELQRVLESGTEVLSENYFVNFDCSLDHEEYETAQRFSFCYDMSYYFPGNDAPLMCLTNCGDTQGWESLGISNIQENSWQTNDNYLYSGETANPVLAAFPDGSYSIDVTCYAHVNEVEPDPEVPFSETIPCELHNFAPALQSVSIIGLETYYSGVWEPNGTSAELAVSGTAAPAGAELQVILIFTEEMNTSQGISVILGPLSVSGTWSSSVVPNDTWTGEVTLPTSLTDGSYILSVGVEDVDGNHLMDPEGAGTVPGPTRDTHHSLSLQFETGLEWTVPVHDEVLGSPKLADMNGDGVLDIIIQSADGWVDILDDNGSSMNGWPVDVGWIPGTDPEVWASPAIANMSTSSPTPEILAVHPHGCCGYEYTGEPISPWIWDYGGQMATYFACSSPVVADLDNDGYNEFAVGRQNRTGGSNPISMYIKETNGSSLELAIWGTDESVTSTPSICDVDGNGSLEVIAVTDALAFKSGTDNSGTVYCFNPVTGDDLWSTYVGGMFITGAISTGKILAGETVGVVVGAHSGSNSIKVLNGVNGYPAYPPLPTAGGISAGTSIADVNGDGHLDIVASSMEGYLYCWRGDTGEDNPGFPVNLGAFTDDGISIGDIDGDGMLELVIAGTDGKLHGINHDGSTVNGFPVSVSGCNNLSGQPAIGDIDGDGRLEIVFGEENNSVLHCYEMADNSAYTYLPWPQFQHDAMNTGYFETDISIPEPPTDFEGEGELGGMIFTADLSWIMSVNDPNFEPVPTPPADVINYRIYRMIPPRPVELIATVSAGDSTYTDVINLMSFFPMVAYSATAWDGVNESEQADWVKIPVFGLDNIAAGCPVREIIHSDAIPVSRTHSAILNRTSYPVDLEYRNGCRILTDGEYDAVYIPSGSSDCIEIDLGDVCTVRDVNVIRDDMSLTGSPRYELSVNGRSFNSADTGRARYIRVYSVAGASEIEVSGSLSDETSALIEIQRNTDSGYRIAAVESGAPITATVFDLSGRSIWQNTSSTGEILWNRCSSSGNTVPAGVYLIMVESDDIETFTSKVVVR